MPDQASRALGIAVMIVAATAVYLATGWPWKAALFPTVIGIVVFCLAAAEVLWTWFGSAAAVAGPDFQMSGEVPARTAMHRTLLIAAWMAGFFLTIALIGFPAAAPLFVFVYLVRQGRESWRFALIFSAVLWGFFHAVFDRLLHLPFPKGWLLAWAGM